MTRLRFLLTLAVTALLAGSASAQSPPPPNAFHPYPGGRNCIQVADVNRNFNCAGGTTVDPATGNLVIAGTISFTGTGGFSTTYFPGLVVGAVGLAAQTLGTSDLVIATSPWTVATAGPLIRGATIRVRQTAAGRCQLVIAGGNGLQEFVIPVLPPSAPFLIPYNPGNALLQTTFPGGPAGC